MPERFPANQPFTIRAYLTRMGRLRGLGTAASALAVDVWAQRLQLERHLGTRLAEVSKGTAQKVGLAQALLRPPELLVLDEPWEGLDAQTRATVPAIVAEVLSAGGRVLISDHLGEVDRLAGAAHWTVANRRVAFSASSTAERAGIEVAVARAEVDATVARLRGEGHEVVRVRES